MKKHDFGVMHFYELFNHINDCRSIICSGIINETVQRNMETILFEINIRKIIDYNKKPWSDSK